MAIRYPPSMLIKMNELEEAIQRVRELAEELDDYDWKSNEASYKLTGHLVAIKILKALDGEQ